MRPNSFTAGGKRFSPEILERISKFASDSPEISRRQIAQEVCQWLDWFNSLGKPQLTSCIMALGDLARRGHIVLPKPKGKGAPFSLRVCDKPVPLAVEVPDSVEKVMGLQLHPVTHKDEVHTRIWNTLMSREHPLGLTRLIGRQVRYLIGSSHGWLGAVSFSAAALKLKARDEWIGWRNEERKENLQLAANMSRFLIRPGIECKNLASKVLSLCATGLKDDWPKKYGDSLVFLETFVNPKYYEGVSYKAANWERIGSTVGRGRQDRHGKKAKDVKDIFAYPLCSDFREILCNGRKTRIEARSVLEDNDDWISREFGGIYLGDKRLGIRSEKIAAAKWETPCAGFPQIFQDYHQLKGAYRFFSNKNEEMTQENLMRPHYDRTLERMANEKVVLVPSDTTYFNYDGLFESTEGLGSIGKNQSSETYGLLNHGSLALNQEGIPLGILNNQCKARETKTHEKKDPRGIPIEDKETYKWIEGYQASNTAALQMPNTLVVYICDREGDVQELFEEGSHPNSKAKLLVRASHNRNVSNVDAKVEVEDGEFSYLWDLMNKKDPAGTVEIEVPRRKGKKKRIAECEVTHSQIQMPKPRKWDGKAHLPVKVWCVHLKEVENSDVKEPVEWMLLSTVETQTFKQALKLIRWYCKRWVIEEWHKVIKSGCKAEERQLETAKALKIALAFDLVIAWRILLMAKLGRETPNVPCTVLFEECEWKMLFEVHLGINKKKTPTLQEMNREVAKLGGFLGRKSDGDPGYITLWRGLIQLRGMTGIYCKMSSSMPPAWYREISDTS